MRKKYPVLLFLSVTYMNISKNVNKHKKIRRNESHQRYKKTYKDQNFANKIRKHSKSSCANETRAKKLKQFNKTLCIAKNNNLKIGDVSIITMTVQDTAQ